METLKYTVIKSDKQYYKYAEIIEDLVESGNKSNAVQSEIELLTLLVDTYDEKHNTFEDADPIVLLKALMKDHKIKAVDLANLLNVSPGLVSDMLNYRKGLSKETIRLLAERFKLNQEAFNRPYELQTSKLYLSTGSQIKMQKRKVSRVTKDNLVRH